VFVIGTSIWVYFDAAGIGVKRGQIPGSFDMSPSSWMCGCLLLWIIAFPAYMCYRETYKEINGI
jgi:hypothetical protein